MEKSGYKIKNTLGMFDLYKGYVMVTMIIAHTYGLFDNIGNNPVMMVILGITAVIGEAAMPALFVLSGYGFRKTTFKKCLKRQYNTIIIPYIWTVIITSIVHFFGYYLMYGGLKITLKQTIGTFLGGVWGATWIFPVWKFTISPCGAVWFLCALVVASLVFNELLNRFEGKMLFAAVLITSIIGVLLLNIKWLPWALSHGTIAVVFLYLGYVIKKKKIFINITPLQALLVTIPAAGGFLAIIALVGDFNMAYGQYPLGPVSVYFVGVLGCVCIYWFLHLNRFNGKISTCLRSLGRNSLYILLIHSIEIVAVGRYLQYDFVNNWKGNILVACLIQLVVRMIVVFGCTYGYLGIKKRVLAKMDSKINK
jgi:fucose 4-O-acetylase-like acetyltransferase